MPRVAAFFEQRTPARPLAVCRMTAGVASLLRAYIQYPVLIHLLSGDMIRARRTDWLPDLAPGMVLPLILVWMLASAAFAAGFLTRLSGAVLMTCTVYQIALDQNLFSNNLYYLTLLVFLLTVADSGRALSVDQLLFRPAGPPEVRRWTTLLPRLQISIVYFFSALLKLNPRFLAGQTIEDSTRIPAGLAGGWVAAGVAVITIVIEGFLAFGLWVPRLRRVAFSAGFLLHAGIFLAMNRSQTSIMLTFGLSSLAPYLLFLEHRSGSRLVIWDDNCSFCRRSIKILRWLDWLRIHRLEGSSNPEALREAGVTADEADFELKLAFDGRVLGGFDAVREILCVLPVSFLWAPMLGLPPIRRAGREIYRRVAASRMCAYEPGAGPARSA